MAMLNAGLSELLDLKAAGSLYQTLVSSGVPSGVSSGVPAGALQGASSGPADLVPGPTNLVPGQWRAIASTAFWVFADSQRDAGPLPEPIEALVRSVIEDPMTTITLCTRLPRIDVLVAYPGVNDLASARRRLAYMRAAYPGRRVALYYTFDRDPMSGPLPL
jgi:hypothetical protein